MQQLQRTNEYRNQMFHAIEIWVTRHINRPIKGFDQKKNSDGTLYTKNQQLSSTRYQAMAIAAYFIARGKSQKEILQILEVFS